VLWQITPCPGEQAATAASFSLKKGFFVEQPFSVSSWKFNPYLSAPSLSLHPSSTLIIRIYIERAKISCCALALLRSLAASAREVSQLCSLAAAGKAGGAALIASCRTDRGGLNLRDRKTRLGSKVRVKPCPSGPWASFFPFK